MDKWITYAIISMFFAGFTSVIAKIGLSGIYLLWLGLSGVTTSLSWVFYYKVLKVATVALIDKGSVVVAMLLAWVLLREVITLRIAIGAALIVAGLRVIAKKS